MQGLLIFLAILLFLFLLLLVRIKVVFAFGEEIAVEVRALCFRYRIYPKKKVKIKHYSYKTYQKRLRRALKKRRKEQKKGQKTPIAPKKEKPTIKERISYFTDLFTTLYRRFLHHFRIDIARLRISVATGDAAKTAILTGVVSQSVAYLCEIIHCHTNLHRTFLADISVKPDYLSEKSRGEGKFIFSLRIIAILDLGIRFALHFFRYKLSHRAKKS